MSPLQLSELMREKRQEVEKDHERKMERMKQEHQETLARVQDQYEEEVLLGESSGFGRWLVASSVGLTQLLASPVYLSHS